MTEASQAAGHRRLGAVETTISTEPVVEQIDVAIRERLDTRLNQPDIQKATLYIPSHLDESVPVVVMFHGAGSTRLGLAPASMTLSIELGVVVLNADWLVDLKNPLGAATVADAVCAVSYAYENAASWGGDPKRMMILDESGGTCRHAGCTGP